jgi:hypothetical protein
MKPGICVQKESWINSKHRIPLIWAEESVSQAIGNMLLSVCFVYSAVTLAGVWLHDPGRRMHPDN